MKTARAPWGGPVEASEDLATWLELHRRDSGPLAGVREQQRRPRGLASPLPGPREPNRKTLFV